MGQGAGDLDHRRSHPASPAARRQPAGSYDGRNRVNPPLREASDAEALRQALADGVIDCVATDHAPHAEQEKCCEFANARPGMLGLQTALSVVVETMVRPGLLTWRDVARVMSEAPAAIVGLPDQGRPLAVGEPANLTVVDPETTWTVTGSELASRSDNTPFESMELPGAVTLTLLRGKVTARDGKGPAMNDQTLIGSLMLAAVLALLIAFFIRQMLRGWRHRAERQAELIGNLPALPDTVGPVLIGPARASMSAARLLRTGRTASPVGDWASAPRRC